MAIPRILLAVPLLVAGIVVPAATHRGQTLTLVNNSLFIHITGPGRDSTLTPGAERRADG